MNSLHTEPLENEKPAEILIVDDSASVRYALVKNLTEVGFAVSEATDGVEGLTVATAHEFDLIITDIDMPNMNGFDLCTKLKADPRTMHVPIIVLSSNETDAHVEKGFTVGADAYLAKGGDIGDAIATIKDILQARNFLTGSRVLVVDDSASVCSFLQKGLIEQGFKVTTAIHGKDALDQLGKESFDLILSDLCMPEMDGAELCRAVKHDDRYKAIPIVIMSTVSDKAVMRRLIREGATTYLTKPFTVTQLSIVIEEIFSSKFQLLLEEKERLELEHRLTMDAIASLVQALEARDPLTRGHSERVAVIAQGIGEELGFKQSQLDRLLLIGRLHDLGKIGVRDDVLLKKARLDNVEYEHIKNHSNVVANILRPIRSLGDILEVTTYHHERWDGKGYPDGLKGEAIPLKARIVSVADVFEAVTAERPYRDSMPRRVAVEIIKDERGKQLCPTCVDAFLRWFKRTGGEIDVPDEFRQH